MENYPQWFAKSWKALIQGHAKLMHDPIWKSVCCCQLAKKGDKNRTEKLKDSGQRYGLESEEKRLSW